MIAGKPKRGRPKGTTNKNNQPPLPSASTPTPSDPSSSREISRLALRAASKEGSIPPHPPNRDKSRSVYRLALGSAGVAISEGFLTYHPKLPEPIKDLLEPIACIPQSVKERFPIECSKVSDEYFYTEKPPYLEDAQVAAIEYLFLQRDGDMYGQSTAGITEASWALYTKEKLFVPLFDPTGKMKKLVENTILSYPGSVGEVSRELMSPQPDILYGSSINRSNFVSEFFEDRQASKFSLDHRRLRQIMTITELLEAGCGATGENFCFPTFVVERESDCEPLFPAENQLLGCLRCMFDAQKIAKSRIDNDLPVLPLGIANVGNWISFWACWPNDSREDRVMSAAHVTDYHLFKVESAIEFVSLSVQIVRWIREYQGKLFNGIMKDRPSPSTVSIVATKREHELDNEDAEGDIRSKRQNTKRTEAKPTTKPTALSHADHPPPERPKKGDEESWVADVAESRKYTPDERGRHRDIIAYLENQESLSSLGDQFDAETTGVGIAEFYHQLKATIESPREVHAW